MEEEEDQVQSGPNRGSLSFFDEDEIEEEVRGDSGPAQPVDNIDVSVLSCVKEGNDFNYTIKVGVAGCNISRVLVTFHL